MFTFNRQTVELQAPFSAPQVDTPCDDITAGPLAPQSAELAPHPDGVGGVPRARRYHLVGTSEPVERGDFADSVPVAGSSNRSEPPAVGQRETNVQHTPDWSIAPLESMPHTAAPSKASDPVTGIGSTRMESSVDAHSGEVDRRQLSPSTPSTAADGTSSERRQFYCPTCAKTVISEVSLTPSIWTFVIGFVAFIIFGWLALCIVPFLWPLSQIVVHKCQLCQQTLSEHRRVSCFRHREEIFTLRAGNCAIVLSKRYVFASLILLILIFGILLLRWYLVQFGLPELTPGPPSDVTWNDFLEDCGQRSLLGNPIKAQRLFTDRYSDRTVRWRGRVHHVQEGIFRTHFLYVDMSPPYYQRDDWRDIAMTFGKRLTSTVEDLDPGDEIGFEATLLDLGRRGRPLLAMLWQLNVTGRAADLPPYQKRPSSIVIFRGMFAPPMDLPGLIARQIGGPEPPRPLVLGTPPVLRDKASVPMPDDLDSTEPKP